MQACLSIKSYGFMRYKAHVIQENQCFGMTSSYACCFATNIDFFLRMRKMATVKVFKAEFLFCYCACTRMFAGITAIDKNFHRSAIYHVAPRT